MRLPVITITALYLLGMCIVGLDSFEFQPWITGFLMNVVLLNVWWASKATRTFLSLFGAILLLAVALGFVGDVADHSRAFFNGMAFATFPGLFIAYLLYYPRSAKAGYFAAKIDGYNRLAMWFEKRMPDQ